MKTLTRIVLAGVASIAALSIGQAATAEVGKAAPDFSLTDINGNKHSLSEFKGKTVVLEWVNPECPFVMKHYDKSGNIRKTQKAATSDGVVWLQINSGSPGAQGDFAMDENNHALAVSYFEPVEKFPEDPHYPFALYRLAWSHYNLKNRSEHDRTVLIEHPFRPDFKITS